MDNEHRCASIAWRQSLEGGENDGVEEQEETDDGNDDREIDDVVRNEDWC